MLCLEHFSQQHLFMYFVSILCSCKFSEH